MLSVLTYNIQYGRKLSSIIQWLNSLEKLPDILCFQEFPDPTSLRLLLGLRGARENYDLRFVQSLIKKRKFYGQLTLYNKKILTLIKHTDVHLGNSKLEKILSFQSKGRNALITSFRYKNKVFELINAHLTAFHLNETRRRQILMIMDSIKEGTEKIPTIFLGDLNYSSLLRQSKLIDLMKKYGLENAFSLKTHKLFFLRHQLDYVFYKNCQIVNPEVIKINYSDHYPVQFQLKLENS